MEKELVFIKIQQKYFEFLLDKIKKTTNIEDKIDLACFAANYATYHHTGYYYSKILEKEFVDYAKTIQVELNKTYSPNSFLHVLTVAQTLGGHTRVVEKWIEQSSSNQIHSVVCINQQDYIIPQKLKEVVNSKKGQFVVFNYDNLRERAVKLRQIASNYEYIILHMHMDDPTALVAFGIEDFKRPIIFYNHADHMFWLGKSIIDKLANLRDCSDKLTIPKRNIPDSFKLGVPIEIDNNINIIDKNEAKAKLGFDTNKKLIISVGGAHKYKSFKNKSFTNYLLEILHENDNVQIVVIGPASDEKLWDKVSKKSNYLIKAIGEVDYDKEYFDYLNAADLVIDSWPMGGGSVMIDAISCGTPILSLENPFGQFDYLVNSIAYCKTPDELYKKVKLTLYDNKFKNDLLNEIKLNFEKDHSIKNWGKKLEQLIQLTPKVHTVKDLSQELENKEIDDASILLNCIYNSKFLQYKKHIIYCMLYYFSKYIIHNKKLTFKFLKKMF